jgi:hypothetical protein
LGVIVVGTSNLTKSFLILSRGMIWIVNWFIGHFNPACVTFYSSLLHTHTGVHNHRLHCRYLVAASNVPLPVSSRTDRRSVGHSLKFLLLSESWGFVDEGVFSDERAGLSFTIATDLASAIFLGSESHGTHDHILLSNSRLPQLGGPGPCIYIPQDQGGPVILPGTGFPFRRLLRLVGLQWMYYSTDCKSVGRSNCYRSWL